MSSHALACHFQKAAVRLLPIQELPQPELQPLATEAKLAASLLKYLPLPAALLPPATDALAEGTRADMWPARAAALVFAQASAFCVSLTSCRDPACRQAPLSRKPIVVCFLACAHAEHEGMSAAACPARCA